MAGEDFDPGANSQIVGTGGTRSTDYDPGGSRYPDMTPGPPKTPILSTSHLQVGSDTRSSMPWDNWQPPSFSGVAERVGTEMKDAYENTPPLLTKEARDALGRGGWPGKVAQVAGDVASTARADFSALGAGGMAALSELFSAGDPKGARDAHALLSILPILQTGAPPIARPSVRPSPEPPPSQPPPPPGPPGPVSLGQVTTAVERASPPSWRVVAPGEDPVPGREYRMNQQTGQREVNEGGPAEPPNALNIPPPPPKLPPPPAPAEAIPIRSPEDAMRVYEPQRAAAQASDFQLLPQFTHDWVGSLDKHVDMSPAERAATPGGNSVTKLVDDLRNTTNAPIDNIDAIQGIEKRIRSAISAESGPGGDPNQVRQMWQIMQDFRDRYQNVSPDQFTGSQAGIDAYKNSVKTYAVVSRLRDVQDVIDSTAGNPNRANLLASRMNAFLSDDRKTKGWNDTEIAAMRKAANSGYLQELMRTYSSRLLGIGAAAAGGLTGAAIAVPAQVGLSYAVRSAAENARLARLQGAMEVLGQRAPQPNTLPPTPPPVQLPQSVVSGARYAPLAGLLGQATNQPGDERYRYQ